jgi:hypothetical protein
VFFCREMHTRERMEEQLEKMWAAMVAYWKNLLK